MSEKKEQQPYGPLRRKDRELSDRAAIDAILDTGRVMSLGLADDNNPFVVPVFYAYDGTSLYFHSARVGTKIRILKRNARVCFAVSLDQGVVTSAAACDFEACHRTVIGFGRAHFLEDPAEKAAALDRIVARFTDRKFEYPAAHLQATAVVRIEIVSVTGKTYGLDGGGS